MSPIFVALYVLGTVFGGALMVAPFVRRFRGGSVWLRLGLFATGLLSIANSSLGFYLLIHEDHGKTSLPPSQFWALDHVKSNIEGLIIGMLICLFLSPECRRLNQPTRRV